jgi:hypothetical protein
MMLIGCNEDGLAPQGRGSDLASASDLAAPDLSFTPGSCPGDTPGFVDCVGVRCPIGQCWICFSSSVCSPTPPDAFCFTEDCDGPEDCPNRQTCSVFESTTCGDPVEQEIYCHCDAECPPDRPHCDGLLCQK